MEPDPVDLLPALFGSSRIDTGDGDFILLNHIAICKLTLPTGRLVAMDPGSGDRSSVSYYPQLEAGTYPVHLVIARLEGSPQERITAAYVRAGEGAVSSWSIPKNSSSYLAETAKGAFLDQSLCSGLATIWDDHLDSPFARQYSEQYQLNYRSTWSWVNTIVDQETGANIVTFLSGMGDGYYPCYVGSNAVGQPIVFLTDFLVLYRLMLPPDWE
jgi:hypothetical protein